MTNNPTIDGVRLLPCPFCGQSNVLIEQLDSDASVVICQGLVSEHCACLARGPVGVQDNDDENQPGKDAAIREWNKRATPVVERQPVAPFYISTEDWNLLVRGDIDTAPVRISRTRRGKFTESLFAHPPEVAALQSTIAQLQARVAELESGRGEPVAWMVGAGVWNIKSEAEKYASGRIVTPLYNSPQNKELAACPDGWKIVPITPTTEMKRNGLADRHDGLAGDIYRAMLDVAPPPPVGKNPSASLPDRQSTRDSFECGGSAQEQFSMGWNACLDATAALNGPAK